MNRINQMIDMHATIAAVAFYKAVSCGRDGFFEEAADFTDKMLEARGQLKTWIKISQAIRGGNCDMGRIRWGRTHFRI